MIKVAMPLPRLFAQRHAKRVLVVLAALIALVIALQQYQLDNYNNFTIFRQAFGHLLQHTNLYLPYPGDYNDLFLYNPTFAVLFAPFSYLPVWMGMAVWCLLGMFAYLFVIDAMPITGNTKLLVLAVALPDSINALQHLQVNHLCLAFFLLTFIGLRNGKPAIAALCTVLALFIKVYPAAAGLCFLFFPNKKQYIMWCLVWTAVLFALPLLFVSPSQLLLQYQNWFASLQADRSAYENATSLSLISINHQWLPKPLPVGAIQLTGLLAMLLPLATGRKFFNSLQWQLHYLATLLLFIIVFNHAAESATYLLAVTGATIWFVTGKKSTIDRVLFALVVLFTVITVTDLVPGFLKRNFIQPYSIRAVPCVLVWLRALYQLLTSRFAHDNSTLRPDHRTAAL